MTELILQAIYSGLLAGGVYALLSLGLALIFGTMRIINLAHGELVLLAAYFAYTLETRAGFHPLAAIPLALLLVCACSLAVYFLVSRIRVQGGQRELHTLMLTFAIGIILTNTILLIWSADVRATATQGLQVPLQVGVFYSMWSEIIFFGISLVLVAGLWWWLSRSWYGRAVRAVSSNREAAKLMGINPHRTEWISFLIAGVLATFAGVAIYSSGVIFPSLGHALTIKAFIISVLAGVGSIPGILAAALLIGVTEALTVTLFSSALQEMTGMVLFLLVLFVLPNGLFGAAARRG